MSAGSAVTTTATAYECSLYGQISNNRLSQVLERLIGICGINSKNKVYEHEVIFIPKMETPSSPAQKDDVLLRLKSVIEDDTDELACKERHWVLFQYGHPEPRTGRPVTVRPIIHVKIGNGGVFKFMSLLGYRYSFELTRRGYWFIFNDTIRVCLSQVFKVEEKFNLKTETPIDENNGWLIEVTSAATNQENVNRMSEVVLELKTLLSGLVELKQIDHLVLQNKILYN